MIYETMSQEWEEEKDYERSASRKEAFWILTYLLSTQIPSTSELFVEDIRVILLTANLEYADNIFATHLNSVQHLHSYFELFQED